MMAPILLNYIKMIILKYLRISMCPEEKNIAKENTWDTSYSNCRKPFPRSSWALQETLNPVTTKNMTKEELTFFKGKIFVSIVLISFQWERENGSVKKKNAVK